MVLAKVEEIFGVVPEVSYKDGKLIKHEGDESSHSLKVVTYIEEGECV